MLTAALSLALLSVLALNVHAVNNGLGLLPPIGWNTWCTQGPCERDYCDEAEVMEIADVIVSSGLKDMGFEYLNLNDCWASARLPNGTITADPTRFPNGMAYVADYLHSYGLKYGLVSVPVAMRHHYTCSSRSL